MRYLLLLVPVVLLAGPPRYGRVGEFEGKVEVQPRASEPWLDAERNLPLPESAWIRTGPASRIEIELDEGSVVRVGANSQLELSDYTRLSTGQRVTLLSLEHGLAYVTGQPEGRDALTLAVPGAQVTFVRGARVRLEVQEQWSQIAVLRGVARFSSPAADIDLREGQTTRVEPANAGRFFFYKEVLPMDLDKWSEDRDTALAAATSAAHIIQRYGLKDLDASGEWILTEDLGAVWRPKVEGNWLPFQNGRWRWFDGLGYTWVSDDPWGWLPYHYGRWTRLDNLGWVWTPSKNGVFKPGEVYWLRGAKFVGWGPLAPGEQWDPAGQESPMPQQFLNAHTTYAAFRAGESTIEPAGFAARPKDPLKGVEFLAAPASPAFLASKLDAVRPLVTAATLRVRPVVDGITMDTTPRTPVRPQPAAVPAPPIVIVTEAAPPQAPADPEVVEVPVPVPVPVPSGIVFVPAPPVPHAAPRKAAAPAPAVPATHTGRREGTTRVPVKKYRNNAEASLAAAIVQELDARSFPKAAADLDQWTQRFHDTDFADDRAYYYMLAYNGLSQPAKVLEMAATLIGKPVSSAFEDPMQALSVVYLTAMNYQKVGRPTREQSATAKMAARELLGILPTCFTPEHKPQVMSASDWSKSRTDLEALARDTVARAGR